MPKNYVKVNDVVTENQLATAGMKSIMKEHSYFHQATISRDFTKFHEIFLRSFKKNPSRKVSCKVSRENAEG